MATRLDELLAEVGWVRRLARVLVRDVAVADDVAQDAWLLAIQHAPTDARPLRPWLRRVVLNVVRMRHRSTSRRDAREAAIEQADVPTPADLVEHVELQRAVADEVSTLAEPYRSTVLFHFVEGLSSSEIARRLGVPDGTVRRRLKVAIDQLRERLQCRSDGPKHGWLAALVPFARMPDSTPTAAATVGVFAMKKLTAAAGVLVLLLVTGLVAWSRHSHTSRETSSEVISNRGAAAQPSDGNDPQRTNIPSWIPQSGVAGRRIAGHVTSAGVPVGGAIVRLALVSTPAVLPIADVRTGPDGTFDFGIQPAAVFGVSASAPKLTSSYTVIPVADPRAKPDQIALELSACRSRLYGTVRDASGGGIAKARLLSTDFGGNESDATGQYSLCLPQGDSRVRVEADGYGTFTLPFRTFGELRYDFVLAPEAILTGRVITDGHMPVAGAQVIASPDDVGALHHLATCWTTTDRDGRFQIAGVAPGRFQVSAFAEGLGTHRPQQAIARPASSSPDLQLVLEAVAQVRGRVVMAGQPVSGARIITMRNGLPSSTTSFSQPDGRFILSGVLPGATVFVARPYEVRGPNSLKITQTLVDDVVLDVRALATLRGHVTRNGKPVAGAEVSCAQCQISTESDQSGAFVLEGLPEGSHRISAGSHNVRAFAEQKTVTLAAGDDKTLDIELDCAGQVKGTVVDEDGQPVPNAYVRLELASGAGDQGESMTDTNGAFDCGSMQGGDYRAAVYPSPLAGWAFAPAVGEQLGLIHVPRDGTVTGIKLAIKHERVTIRGKVVDDLGADLSDVHVEAIGLGRGRTEMGAGVMSDATGRFEIGNLARGSYSLLAYAADGSETELFNIPTGSAAVTIKLARPGAIEGTLLGFSTTPAVEIHTETSDLSTGRYVLVEGGRFSASGLPPGRYTVRAKAGTEVDGQAVEVHPGESIQLMLRSRGLGRINGKITEYGGNVPVAGMRCEAHPSMDGQIGMFPPDEALQAVSDATGQFSVSAPIGVVQLVCFPPNGASLSVAGTEVEVSDTAASTVALVAVRNTAGAAPGNPGFAIAKSRLPLTINQIDPGGPAASTGLAIGDQVLAIDGTPTQSMLPMAAMVLLGNRRPGTTVTIDIARNGTLRTIQIVVGATKD